MPQQQNIEDLIRLDALALPLAGLLALAGLYSTFKLTLTGLGVYAYAIPALSRAYLSGKPESIRILDYIFAGPLATIFTLVFLLYSAGLILFGVAIWRSGGLPRWAGVLLAVHAPLISGPFSIAGSVVGLLLALVGGGWIALSVLRPSPVQRVKAEVESRVS